MEKDKRILGLIMKLYDEAEEFISFVNQIGNQCAYTDRIAENIIVYSEQLRNVYEDD